MHRGGLGPFENGVPSLPHPGTPRPVRVKDTMAGLLTCGSTLGPTFPALFKCELFGANRRRPVVFVGRRSPLTVAGAATDLVPTDGRAEPHRVPFSPIGRTYARREPSNETLAGQ